MGDRQNRFKIAPLVGIGLAAAIAWLGAGEALSATVGPNIGGGGPRISTPSISTPRISTPSIGTVGPRGGNFRIGPGTEPKGNPEIGDGRPPRKKGGSNIVIIPPGSGGPPKVTLGGSSGTPFRRIGTGVPPAGELRYIPNKVVIEIGGNPSREVDHRARAPFQSDADRICCICRSPTRPSFSGRFPTSAQFRR